MEHDLEALRARSLELNSSYSEEALTIHQQLLAADPHFAAAHNRVGITLFKLGRLEEAEAVLAAAPASSISRNQLAKVRRALSAPPPPPRLPKAPTYWLKGVHYAHDGWTVLPGEETWVSDIGQRDAEGNRVHTRSGDPAGRPSWRVGDEAALYFSGTLRIPVLVEIIGPPGFDPAAVVERDGSEEAGERWPWVTPVRGLLAKPLDEAPTLSDLGMDSRQVMQLSRMALTADTHARIRSALDG